MAKPVRKKVARESTKKSAQKAFLLTIDHNSVHYHYVMADSAEHARKMFEGEVPGFEEAEYDYDECGCGMDSIISISEVDEGEE
jgi:hypothetical protein